MAFHCADEEIVPGRSPELPGVTEPASGGAEDKSLKCPPTQAGLTPKWRAPPSPFLPHHSLPDPTAPHGPAARSLLQLFQQARLSPGSRPLPMLRLLPGKPSLLSVPWTLDNLYTSLSSEQRE